MRLVQFMREDGSRRVGLVSADENRLLVLAGIERIYDLALEAGRTGESLEKLAVTCLSGEQLDYDAVVTARRLMPPLDHPDPAHCHVTGTGLTHLGSAQARDAMHVRPAADTPVTDSMRLFQLGLEGGKPGGSRVSVQPEWFYKGNGHNVVLPEQPLLSPSFALDGGEEAELVGLYVIADTGEVLRVGFALGNEFSDHVMEAQNYLYLAHSKLRPCSFGPELLVGNAPEDIRGHVRVIRDGEPLWQDTFLTGEANMSYTLANLEHHHFKYDLFRQPGDVHCHFFGAATLSRKAGIVTQAGDCFEISAPGFGRPLRNALEIATGGNQPVSVISL
jgi:hypothetical protein